MRLSAPGLRSTLLFLLFVLSLPAVTTRFYASDEVEFYAWLRSGVFDRDADFTNEYRAFYDAGVVRNDGFRDTFVLGSNEAGRRPNFTPIGTALLWAPFFVVGHAAALATGAPADGFSEPYIAAVTYGSALYGFAALLITAAIVRRLIGPQPMATMAVWLGSPLLFYMYVAPGFSHAASAFAVSLFIWVWMAVRERWNVGGAIALGATGALMAMVREQDAFFLIGPAVDFVVWWARAQDQPSSGTRRSALQTAAAGALTFGLAYIPQLLAYQALNGHPGPTRLVARKMTWTAPHFLEVLFSPQHGLFFWTPLALAGVAGLVRLAAAPSDARARDARWLGTLLLLMFVVQVYVSGSVESWTVAGSFGQRRFVATTPLLAAGLAIWMVRPTPLRRLALSAILVLGIWWNLGLMAQFGLNTMDRQRLALAANARATFIDLPLQAPSLAWRYFTDRSSFFARPVVTDPAE